MGKMQEKPHIRTACKKVCHETVNKKYFGQFYNFLTKEQAIRCIIKSKWVLRE